MAVRYRWAPGNRSKGSAQIVGAELHRLQRESAGALTPGQVLEAARDPRSPLHGSFEWDDRKAAEDYRLMQARWIIGGIREVVATNDGDSLIRVFVNLEDVDDARSYVTVARVLSDAELWTQAKAQFLREAQAFQQRYEEFADLRNLVRKMRTAAAALRRRGRKVS